MLHAPNRDRRGLSKLEWLIAAVVISLLVGFGYEAFTAHLAADYERRANDAFRNTMLGLFNYYDAHGCLPDPILVDENGEAQASWRFLISNSIDATNWYIPDQTKPWIKSDKSEFDLKVVAQSPNLYSFGEKTDFGPTRIVAVTGPDTAFDEKNRCSTFNQLPAGIIVLVEVAHSQVLWTEPGDFVWTGDPADADHHGALKIGAARRGRGFHVAFKDGTVWLLSPDMPMSELSRFFTREGASQNDREKNLGKYKL
jgi:hypothetical protein